MSGSVGWASDSDSSSGYALRVMGLSPTLGFIFSKESGCPSPFAPTFSSHACILSKINKIFSFLNILFIYLRERERTREREREHKQGEEQREQSRKSDAGLDPRTPGS